MKREGSRSRVSPIARFLRGARGVRPLVVSPPLPSVSVCGGSHTGVHTHTRARVGQRARAHPPHLAVDPFLNPTPPHSRMRCLYEVLDVARDADDATLRTAYRRAALRWHPDKNVDDPTAGDRFKEVQSAWEVLSDAHERAWYDGHRDAILASGRTHQAGDDGGGAGDGGGEPPPDEPDLFPYFTSAAFTGYGDGAASFYGVYGALFARLATAEREAGPDTHFPTFGGAHTDWAAVSAFYAAWAGFTTAKPYAWADAHNPASAPDRRVRRLMVDDNRKRRARARRAFTDTVRELVAFVKKRDKRVAAAAVAAAEAAAAAAAETAARAAAAKAERAARAAAYVEPDWVTAGDAHDDGASTSSGGTVVVDVWECVACGKAFRSDGALASHERSRKHRDAVAALRVQLEEEEAELGGGEESEAEVETEEEEEESEESEENETDASPSSASSCATPPPGDGNESEPASSVSSPGAATDDDEALARAFGRATAAPADAPLSSSSPSSSSSSSSDAAAAAAADMARMRVSDAAADADVTTSDDASSAQPREPPSQQTAKGKAKARRAKRAAAAATAAATAIISTTCRECGERFGSRTQLFKHLSETGHR